MCCVVLVEADIPKRVFENGRIRISDVEEHELGLPQMGGREDLRLLAAHHCERVEALGGEQLLLGLDAAVVVMSAQ